MDPDPPRLPDPPALTVAFSTRSTRALALDAGRWPRAAGLDWLVLVQEPAADPRIAPHLDALAARPDVTVVPLATTGLSRSRNAALDLSRGEILLIADDDVTHLPGAFQGIRRFFAENPRASLMTGRAFGPDGAPRRPGRTRARRLTLLNSARTSSHELAIRLAPVREAGIRFDEAFGAGAGTPAFLGEEYVFIADCLRAGLRGWALPLPIGVHPGESSGYAWEGTVAARAAVLARVFGPLAPLARLGFALRNRRRFASAAELARFLRG